MLHQSVIEAGRVCVVSRDHRFFDEELLVMFKRQFKVNCAYAPDWQESYDSDEVRTAALFEFTGETMKEMEGQWKFFGSDTINVEKAAFELADTMCFLMTNVMLVNMKSGITDADTIQFSDFTNTELVEPTQLREPWIGLTRRIVNNGVDSFHELGCWLSYALATVGITKSQFMEALFKKHEIALTRAKLFKMTGSYGKETETAPSIENKRG